MRSRGEEIFKHRYKRDRSVFLSTSLQENKMLRGLIWISIQFTNFICPQGAILKGIQAAEEGQPSKTRSRTQKDKQH